MSAIRFHNRYSGELEEEAIYGEGFLRWAYETRLGRLSLWAVARRLAFSHWYGWRMNRPKSRAKVARFIRHFGLDVSEFADPPESYKTFNEFFCRRLKPEARPICEDPSAALPADGRHLGIERLGDEPGLYVKGQRFDLESFLGDASMARTYDGGTGVISRLCPVDYHRYHAPVAGRIVEQRCINGWLYSVSPVALRRHIRFLWENKRVLTTIESGSFGRVCYVAIGATNVGSIHMTHSTGATVAKGEEMGYFAFGGSCVVTLYEPGRIDLAADLREHGSQQREVYARVGDHAGRLRGD